jgi:hypothetical protein
LRLYKAMARIFIILFAGFYLLISTGINVSAHWCGKKIRLVSIASSHEKKCPCGTKMRPGCCKDVHAYFKITDNQKISSQVVLPVNSFAKALTTVAFQKSEKLFAQVEVFDISNYHAPPFKTKLPVYLRSSILRI